METSQPPQHDRRVPVSCDISSSSILYPAAPDREELSCATEKDSIVARSGSGTSTDRMEGGLVGAEEIGSREGSGKESGGGDRVEGGAVSSVESQAQGHQVQVPSSVHSSYFLSDQWCGRNPGLGDHVPSPVSCPETLTHRTCLVESPLAMKPIGSARSFDPISPR